MYLHPVQDIDVVFTWVDSNDLKWQKDKAILAGQIKSELVSADNDERYANRNELLYSLRSIWMYAPFVRKIFIVTADQTPRWLNHNHKQIELISHRDIFPKQDMLPTFNSHAIEACLHRIPGLSEYFLYFNDDVMLGNLVEKDDFFTRGGLPKVRFSLSQIIIEHQPAQDAIPTDWAAYNANSIIIDKFGIAFSRKSNHVPFPLKKSILQEIEHKCKDEIERTRYATIRSKTDIALPSMLFPFYGVASGKAVDWPELADEYVYINTGKRDSLNKLDLINKKKPKFFCLNATQYSEVDMKEQYQIINRFFEEQYPFPSPFEKIDPI